MSSQHSDSINKLFNCNKKPYFTNAKGQKWPTVTDSKEKDMAAILDKLDALIASTEELYDDIAEALGLGKGATPWGRKPYMQIDTIKHLRISMYKLYYVLKYYT